MIKAGKTKLTQEAQGWKFAWIFWVLSLADLSCNIKPQIQVYEQFNNENLLGIYILHKRHKPFKNESEWSYGSCCKSMTINHEDIVAHAFVEWNFSDNIHACISKLQSDHSNVVFWVLKEPSASYRLSLTSHFLYKRKDICTIL